MGCCLSFHVSTEVYEYPGAGYRINSDCDSLHISCNDFNYTSPTGSLYIPKRYNGKTVVKDIPVLLERNAPEVAARYIKLSDVDNGILFADEFDSLPDDEKSNYYEATVANNMWGITTLTKGTGNSDFIKEIDGKDVLVSYNNGSEGTLVGIQYKVAIPILTNSRGDNDIRTTSTVAGNEICIYGTGSDTSHWWIHDGDGINGHTPPDEDYRIYNFALFWISTFYDDELKQNEFNVSAVISDRPNHHNVNDSTLLSGERYYGNYDDTMPYKRIKFVSHSATLENGHYDKYNGYNGWVKFCEYTKVINLHYNLPRAEKVYDGYPFRCNQFGFFDDNDDFPSRVEVYDDDDVFRGYSYHYHYIHGHIDVITGEWIQDADCSTIGTNVGVYDFFHSVNYNVEENKDYFTESELEDLDNIEFNYVKHALFSAEIKPRKISFEMSDIELQDKVYDGEPIHYNEDDVSVIVGEDGFAVYEDEDGNIITEGADVKIRFNETPEFTKNVLEDNEKYYLTYSIYVEDLVSWENTDLERNYDFTKLIYTKQKSARITPRQLTPSNAYDISSVYNCSNKVFLTADDFTLDGLVYGDENRVQFIVSTQTDDDDDDVIREIGTHNVTYHYSLGGVGARNYTLSRTSDTATVTITEDSILLDAPIVAMLGDEMWENGSLFSTYDSETQKITVRAYMSDSSTHIPQYIRVLAGSASYGTVSIYNQIPTYSFDGETYNSINTQIGHISSKAIYNTTNRQKRKGNLIYWEVEFDVCDYDSSNVIQAIYDNKWHPNVTYNVFVWGFDEGCNTSNINYETFKKLKTETLPPNIGDIAVFLVDTPATPENEHQCGDSWYSEDTPHTLVNAIHFAMDNATILFSGSLMNNQQNRPIVSTEIEYGLYYAVTIDASKPYKIIKNENNEDEIVVDDSVANWSGVVIIYDEKGGTFNNVLFNIDTDTNNAVTFKNIYFKSGGCCIEAITPTYVYDCIIDGFIHRPLTMFDDFKISRCIVKNSVGNLLLPGSGIVDDCLFINNNKIFNAKSHKVKVYNCTIIAPTDDFVDSRTPYKSDENSTGLTIYDFFNCFISGYPITYYHTEYINNEYYFYNRVAKNNIILHTNSKPTLDSPVINEDNEDVTEDCIRTYNEVYGADNIFNNEVYELSGIDDNPTTNDFLYSNYRPRLKGSYTVVDKGNNSYIQSETDLGGNPRVWQSEEDTQNGIVDIGCYEYIPYSALPSIYLSAMEIIEMEDGNIKTYHNEYIYNGSYNNVFDVVNADNEVVPVNEAYIYKLPTDYNFDTEEFDWNNIDDLGEVIDHYEPIAEEVYNYIPTAKHNTSIPTNEEYKWSDIQNVVVVIPGYKACFGRVYVTITPKPLYLYDFTVTGGAN